ncbi:MAG: LptF/LptG family permease [Mariprofundaceae bacterium]
MVLDRYILRLWAGPFIGFLFIVTGVLLLGRALKLLGMFADKGVEWSIMLTMLAAIMPYFLLITVPIAFLFAMQSMFLKLYQGSEMDAFRASGVSFLRLLRPIIAVALLLWLALTLTSLQWMPSGQKAFQGLFAAIQKSKPAPGFDPQRFNRDMEDFTVYVEGQDEQGRLIGFMLEDARSTIPVVYLAERAEIGKNSSGLTFALHHGVRLEGSMGSLRSLSFEEYQVSINLGEMGLLKVQVWRARVFEMGVTELWQAAFHEERLDAIAELSRRLLLPTTVIVFLFFCLPLSIAPKRSGRAGSYIIGTALMLLIYNVQIVLHQQVTGGNLPWWSMWLGQFTFLLAAIWAFHRASQDRLPSLLLFIEGLASVVHQRVLHFVGHRSDVHNS